MQPTPPREDAEAGWVADTQPTGPPDPEQERVEARRDVQEQPPERPSTPAPRPQGTVLGRLLGLFRR